MLELKNLSFSYQGHPVIQDLSFQFPQSGIFVLMGPSGGGKTTLFRLISGLEKPQNGSICSTHQRLAFAFQEPRLIPWMTCAENVAFVLSQPKSDRDNVSQLLRDMELEEFENAYPSALSGGMKQRLSLCRALATNADLLLLDEPFSGLDAALKKRLAPHIIAANPRGLTLIVTHDERDAELLGASILTLSTSAEGTTLTSKK